MSVLINCNVFIAQQSGWASGRAPRHPKGRLGGPP